MKLLSRPVLAAGLLVLLLSACGGGISIGDIDGPFDPTVPRSSGRAGSVTVSGASSLGLDGTYSSSDVFLSSVLRFSGTPDTCGFLFTGLLQQGPTDRELHGEIHYVVGTDTLDVSFFVVHGVEFRADGSAGAAVDRANNRITYVNAPFRSTRAPVQDITVSGSIPMRHAPKPIGC